MKDTESGFAWGGVAFIVIFFLLIFGLFGFGKKDGYGYGYDGYHAPVGYGKGNDCITDKDIYEKQCYDSNEAKAEKINALQMEVQTLKTEKYIDCQTDKTMAAIGQVGRQVERLDCECLKRPPVWGEAVVPCGHEINERFGRCGGRDRD